MKMLCDCGATLEMPEDFFDVGAYDFFARHGHQPGRVTLQCECGETFLLGPEIALPTLKPPNLKDVRERSRHAAVMAALSRVWYAAHVAHQLSMKGKARNDPSEAKSVLRPQLVNKRVKRQ